MPQSFNIKVATSFLLVLAVLMSGVHSKDLAAPLESDTQKKMEDTHQPIKITPELHHHSDSVAKIHPVNGDGHQTDTRSLRLLQRHKTQPAARLSDRLRNWLQLTEFS